MQQLMHHSGVPYEEAASKAAQWAKGKMHEQIEKGRASASTVIARIQHEVPHDQLVRGRAMRFDGDVDGRDKGAPDGLLVYIGDETQPYRIHPHALGQMCERTDGRKTGLPYKYAQWLQEPSRAGWGTQLLAQNLNEIYGRESSHYLTRAFGGQVRGFLSDHYRILDSRPLVEAFTTACSQSQLVPVDGNATDVRVELKALLPVVFEPAPNEVLCYGVKWHNSDYGKGAHELQLFIDRLVCTNLMIAGKGLRQVHLGKRLDDSITFSQETYALDTATVASAVKDSITEFMHPERIAAVNEMVAQAHAEEVNVDRAIESLKKKLTKSKIEAIRDAYRSADVVNMPAGNTVWRLSNAISWVANQEEDVDSKLELQQVAGSVLPAIAA